ncbi:TetR/AcrR family transcriptional regulator [Streptomyces sp. CA-210063]|uniref:TetR/AcrR family transcriptional regulator n=1 Tax=Streptomyces sp. CA-210063 TaxID=2801029 RepID=UPI00214BA5A5|nr:TetR/AcrR family transcriptional regulator [Streptomyces sp. CA-210063]UUU28466.1 TetR/AcrR family transcriptional regulator [Streptomyces sp. CA-210063]
MAEEMSLRERKKAETRAALCRAAMRIVAEEGLDRLTVEAVAAEGGVSVRTFHNYFGSKEEAVFAHVSEVLHDAVQRFAARPAGEKIWDAFRNAVLASVDEAPTKWADGLAVMRTLRTEPEQLAQHIAKVTAVHFSAVETVAARTGTDPKTDLYPHLVANACGSVLDSAIVIWDGEPLEEFRNRLIDGVEQLRAGLPQPA